jgi:phosphoglycolate phosphatase
MMTHQNNYSLLLLDVDGTLIDTQKGVYETYKLTALHFCEEYKNFEEFKIDTSLGKSADALFEPWVTLTRPMSEIKRAYQLKFNKKGIHLTAPYPGVEEGLRQLNKAGYRIALVSNKGQERLVASMNHLRLSSYIHGIYGKTEQRKAKPDLGMFHEVMIRHNTPKGNILMLGDTKADIEFAKIAGIDVAWASYGYGDCSALKPTYNIDAFKKFTEMLLTA